MQRKSLTAGWLGGLTLLFGVTGIAGAQESFAFEYRPSERILVQSIVESQGELLFTGFAELPDSARGQTTSTAGISRRALPVDGGRYALRVSYDSVRAQYRAEQNAWVDYPLPWDGGLWAEYVADRRMALTGPVGSNDTSSVAVVRAASAEPHLVLPEGYVAVGQEWSSTITVPFTMEIPGVPTTIVTVHLSAPATGLLDSVVARGPDTLAFVSFAGRFTPETVNTTYELGGGPAAAEFWGDVAGRMIWSTGWSAVVSAAVRSRIYQRLEAVPGSGVEDARISATVTTRVRVRP